MAPAGSVARRCALLVAAVAAIIAAADAHPTANHQAHDCIHDGGGIADFRKRVQHLTFADHKSGIDETARSLEGSDSTTSAAARGAALRRGAGNATVAVDPAFGTAGDMHRSSRLLQTTYQSIRITLDLSKLEPNACVA